MTACLWKHFANFANKLIFIVMEINVFKYWWLSFIIGLIAIIAGICCFAIPISSIVVLIRLFIILLIVGGIINVVTAAVNAKWNRYWGWDLARGIWEILLGIWMLMLPTPVIATTLVYIFGFWMMFHSVMGICEACELSNIRLKGWGWLLACSILSLLCSFIFLMAPVCGGIFVLAYIGISFILYGIFRIVLAFKIRKYNK